MTDTQQCARIDQNVLDAEQRAEAAEQKMLAAMARARDAERKMLDAEKRAQAAEQRMLEAETRAVGAEQGYDLLYRRIRELAQKNRELVAENSRHMDRTAWRNSR